MKRETEQGVINPSTAKANELFRREDARVMRENRVPSTREFEGEYWQQPFSILLEAYRSFVPSTIHTFGTITRAELIQKLHSLKG